MPVLITTSKEAKYYALNWTVEIMKSYVSSAKLPQSPEHLAKMIEVIYQKLQHLAEKIAD